MMIQIDKIRVPTEDRASRDQLDYFLHCLLKASVEPIKVRKIEATGAYYTSGIQSAITLTYFKKCMIREVDVEIIAVE